MLRQHAVSDLLRCKIIRHLSLVLFGLEVEAGDFTECAGSRYSKCVLWLLGDVKPTVLCIVRLFSIFHVVAVDTLTACGATLLGRQAGEVDLVDGLLVK